jgi:hypothetical protein
MVTAQELSYATSRDISTFTTKGEEVSLSSGFDMRRSLNMVIAQELSYAMQAETSPPLLLKGKRCLSAQGLICAEA